MINRDDIEAGDKCYTRDGGCLVARDEKGKILIGLSGITLWESDGSFYEGKEYPLDIIRIEKAPKPVVEEVYIAKGNDGRWYDAHDKFIHEYPACIKLIFVNNVWDKEKSEQVK
jgi:hypothetical protein